MAGKHREEPKVCPVCGGSGTVRASSEGKDGRKDQTVRCGACNGSGKQP